MEELRIAVISTTTFPCPPETYGGEVYFWLIAKELAEMGHHVILYACPGSNTPPNGELRYIKSSYGVIDLEAEADVWRVYRDEILECDYIIDCSHNHIPAEKIKFYHKDKAKTTVNVLNGIVSHVPRPKPYNLVVGSTSWYNCLVEGKTQFYGTFWGKYYGELLSPVSRKDIVSIIPWAVDFDEYLLCKEKEDYFLWFGRLTPYKGLHNAIKYSKQLGFRLIVGTNIVVEDHKYWFDKYKTLLESSDVELVLNPSKQRKMELMQKAKALLYPIESHEPFGLVVLEAMACGTPVITTNMGAMPEIIIHGANGYLCNLEDFTHYIKQANKFYPEIVRSTSFPFDYRNVIHKFIDLYNSLKK